jgi:hypothetical protein
MFRHPLEEGTVVGTIDLPMLIGQIGRWRDKVCPAVTSLHGAADDVVSHQIKTISSP